MKLTLGKGLVFDLVKLVVSRLLIQAASGGGKSWLLRKLFSAIKRAGFLQDAGRGEVELTHAARLAARLVREDVK